MRRECASLHELNSARGWPQQENFFLLMCGIEASKTDFQAFQDNFTDENGTDIRHVMWVLYINKLGDIIFLALSSQERNCGWGIEKLVI